VPPPLGTSTLPDRRAFPESDGTDARAGLIDACIVTYNSAATIGRLLDSLRDEPLVATIRILDSNSPDATPELLRSRSATDERIACTFARRNVGFPAGCNVLLRQCTSELVLLVNPDVELRPGVLDVLADAVQADERIGTATCQLRTRDGQPQSEPARDTPSLSRLLAGNAPTSLRRLWRRSAMRPSFAPHAVRDVGATMGALMLLRRAVLCEVGLFDESVFMYLEDLDFSARLVRAGYHIRYHGDVWAWHDSGVSSAVHSDELYALMPQVWLAYFHRYGTAWQRRLVRPALLAICGAGALSEVCHHRGRRKYRPALYQAWRHRPTPEPRW
jgi:N-acetylglucosaminyl-diphospho-decaprenol L-rhamnosyltransferase